MTEFRQFREDLLTNDNLVVNCKTEEQAKELLAWAHSKDKRWSAVQSYLQETYWNSHSKNTCYWLARGEFTSSDYYLQCNRTVLSFEEALTESKYIYDETAEYRELPKWWTGKPILCWVSDNPIDGGYDDLEQKFIISVDTNAPSDYPYETVQEYYAFAEPVIKKELKIEEKIEVVRTINGEEKRIELSDEQLAALGLKDID